MRDIRDNRNYNDVKKICAYISGFLGLSTRCTKSFMDIVSKAIVHKLAMDSLSKEDGRLSNFGIEIPFIGRINMKMNGDSLEIKSVELENKFEEAMKDAIKSGKSTLIDEVSNSAVNIIKKKYSSTI